MAKKTKPADALPGMFKNMLGVQANPIQNQGQLPEGYEKFIEGVPVKAMGTREVFAQAGKDILGNLNTWWKGGLEASDEDAKPLKKPESGPKASAKVAKEKTGKDNTDKLLKVYNANNDILQKVLSEITLLRKITEGSLKFEKKGRGSVYRDTISGTFVKPQISTPATGGPVKSTAGKVSFDEQKPAEAQAAEAPSTGSTLLGAAAEILPDVLNRKPTVGAPAPKPSPAAGGGFLSKAAKFMGGKGGLVAAGVTGAIGGGMFAYEKFGQASNEKQAEVMAAQDQLKSGEISQAEYNKKVEEADKKATITKGEGIGGGVGRAGGAIAGAKVGASFGSFFGPAGTVVGGLAGGALGYMAGGSIGEAVGNIGGRISNFFGGNKTDKTENKFTTKSANFSVSQNGVTTTGEYRDGKYYVNNKEVSEKEYKEIREKLGLTKNDNLLSGKASPSDALEDRKQKAESARQNALQDGASPEEADEIAAKMMKHGSVISAGQGRGDVIISASKPSTNLSPAMSSKSGSVMQAYSSANRDMAAESTGGTTVINNNSSPAAPQPQQSGILPLKPQIRPEASTLTRYLDRVASY